MTNAHPDGTPVPPLPDLRFVEVDAAALGLAGPRLSFMEAGQGPPVLLLHGIGANSMGWRFVLAGLSPVARVIAWNAPGYLMSDPFASDAPRAEDYADVAAALLDALGVAGPAHVIGSSFGSLIGAALAARHPGRVARLALLGTSRGQRWKGDGERARMLAMRAASIEAGGVALARTRWQALVAPGSGTAVAALVQGMVAATDARGLMPAARATDVADVVADFAPRIAAPTLVVTGTEDRVNPPEVGAAVAAAIAGARLEHPAGIGHLPEIEAPAMTLGLLRTFLGFTP
ncbi:alpha/beta fold hydrolase [Roseomonas sp. HF4]|uniref:alpha/beta fold hydrolase n=1 Tax=Roseomonas sp. HF4 TaxID=2562313 RepID=UPI0010C109EA|nr:alpha/beta fold hydrolase [Roseomonas sp. HF4]